ALGGLAAGGRLARAARADEGDPPAARRRARLPEQGGERDTGAAQLGVAAAAQQLAQEQPLRRAGRHVADELGERAVEGLRDLMQDEDRSVAGAVFEIGE